VCAKGEILPIFFTQKEVNTVVATQSVGENLIFMHKRTTCPYTQPCRLNGQKGVL
jgi:hypothetical protein